MLHLIQPDHIVIVIFSALLIMAALHDATSFRIPNWVSVAIAALYPLHAVYSPLGIDWLAALALAVGVFVVGVLLFVRGIVGGGDVKLLTAVSLWAGTEFGAQLMIVTAVIGGVMALIMISPARHVLVHAYDHLGRGGNGNPYQDNQLPYGIAIAAGGLAVALTLLNGGGVAL